MVFDHLCVLLQLLCVCCSVPFLHVCCVLFTKENAMPPAFGDAFSLKIPTFWQKRKVQVNYKNLDRSAPETKSLVRS